MVVWQCIDADTAASTHNSYIYEYITDVREKIRRYKVESENGKVRRNTWEPRRKANIKFIQTVYGFPTSANHSVFQEFTNYNFNKDEAHRELLALRIIPHAPTNTMKLAVLVWGVDSSRYLSAPRIVHCSVHLIRTQRVSCTSDDEQQCMYIYMECLSC